LCVSLKAIQFPGRGVFKDGKWGFPPEGMASGNNNNNNNSPW